MNRPGTARHPGTPGQRSRLSPQTIAEDALILSHELTNLTIAPLKHADACSDIGPDPQGPTKRQKPDGGGPRHDTEVEGLFDQGTVLTYQIRVNTRYGAPVKSRPEAGVDPSAKPDDVLSVEGETVEVADLKRAKIQIGDENVTGSIGRRDPRTLSMRDKIGSEPERRGLVVSWRLPPRGSPSARGL